MITDKGKSIISKFMLGQTTSYASHIAIGCGATPLLSGGTLGDYSTKTALDFEMFRVPIISRGYIFERIQGKSIKIVNGTAIRDMMNYAGAERPAQWAKFLGNEGLTYLSSKLLEFGRDNTSGGTIPFSGKSMSGTGTLSRSLVLRRLS